VAVEERLLAERFGERWDAYRLDVPALIPGTARRRAS
jgi:protein-S-isoprenylcysteine O-methyltransferase Ste14